MNRSNIAYIGTRNADLSATNEEDRLYFPTVFTDFSVHSPDLVVHQPPATQNMAVIRTDTNQVLGFHSEKYNYHAHSDVFPVVEDALRRTNGIDLTDVKVKLRTSYNGGLAVKSYIFPNVKSEVRVGDIVSLKIDFWNSVNGVCSVIGELGGYRFACENGMVVPVSFTHTFGKHTKNLSVEDIADKLSYQAELYIQHQEVWKHWAGKKISLTQVKSLLEKLNVNKQLANTFVEQFKKERKEAGHSTVWELFNSLTNWSTHHDARKGSDMTLVTQNREKQVRKIISSSAFDRLAA